MKMLKKGEKVWGRGGCELRSEAFVNIQKKKIWGGGGRGGVGSGWGGGQGGL